MVVGAGVRGWAGVSEAEMAKWRISSRAGLEGPGSGSLWEGGWAGWDGLRQTRAAQVGSGVGWLA